MNGNYIRGNVDAIILKCLEKGELYGIEICKLIQQASEGTYTLKRPTLYSALTRLKTAKLIRERVDASPIGGARHYFSLTDAGLEFLATKKFDWVYSKTLIDNLVLDRQRVTEESSENNNVVEMPQTNAGSAVATFIDNFAREREIAQRITASATESVVASSMSATTPVASIAVETLEPSPVEQYSATAGGYITVPLQRAKAQMAFNLDNEELKSDIELFKPFVKHANDTRQGKFVLFNRLRLCCASVVSAILCLALGIFMSSESNYTTQETNFLTVGFLCVGVYFLYNMVQFVAFPRYKQLVTKRSNGLLRRAVLSASIAIASVSLCVLGGLDQAPDASDYLVFWAVPCIVGSLFILEGVAIRTMQRAPFFLT